MDTSLDNALELDGPGAIVSHAEVLEAIAGRTAAQAAAELGVSVSTVHRCLRRLRAAGLLA